MENGTNIDEYIQKIAIDGAWGTHLEMAILSKLLRFNVILH